MSQVVLKGKKGVAEVVKLVFHWGGADRDSIPEGSCVR